MRAIVNSLALLLVMSIGAAPAETPASTPVLAHAPGTQYGATSASDGDNFLTVWLDGRDGGSALYGTRVDRNGKVLDPTGIRIAVASSPAQVVWTGSSYLIVWTEQSFEPDTPRYSVRIARVGTDGTVVDPARTLIADAIPGGVASNGTRVVLSWSRSIPNGVSDPTSLHYTLLSRDAKVLAADVEIPHRAGTNNNGTRVISNGSDFLVAWSRFGGSSNVIDTVRINPAGVLLDTTPRSLEPAVLDLMALASDGHDFLLFLRSAEQDSFKVVRTDNLGNVTTPAHSVAAPGDVAVEQPHVVWNGLYYVLVWTDPFTHVIYDLSLDRDGNALGPPHVAASWQTDGLVGDPFVAASREVVLLTWNDSRFSPPPYGEYDVMYRLLEPVILIGRPELLLSQSATRQAAPSIASDGRDFLVAWSEETGVYAGRVTADGRTLDGRGILLSTVDENGKLPSVVFDGHNYLVAWVSSSATSSTPALVSTARIAPDGSVLESGAVNPGPDTCITDVALATGANVSLLVFTTCHGSGLRAITIGRDGRPAMPLPIDFPGSELKSAPAVAWNGSAFVVAWNTLLPVPTVLPFPVYRANTVAARVTESLTLLDGAPIPIAVSSDDTVSNAAPAVAGAGDEALVVWTHNGTTIQGRHVSAAGTLVDETFDIANGTAPAVVADGNRYLVAWTEGKPYGDVLGAHVGRVGTPLPNDRVVIAASSTDEREVALTPGLSGITAAYIRVALEPLYGGVARAFVRDVPPATRLRASRR